MSEFLRNQSCCDFVSALASAAPVPGGGGAAAMAGALSAALCSMAANLTVGKKKFISVEADLKRIISENAELSARLLALIDEDALAFAPLADAYSLPKDSPGYAETMRAATLGACRAPMNILRCCCEAVELLAETENKCSRLMISDVACGAALARAAIECAAANVFVNTRLLKGDEQAALLNDEVTQLLEKYIPMAQAIYNSVLNVLKEV